MEFYRKSGNRDDKLKCKFQTCSIQAFHTKNYSEKNNQNVIAVVITDKKLISKVFRKQTIEKQKPQA